MSKAKSISGTIVYQDFEGGFWGIKATDGEQYRPVTMPEQLKYPGRKVTVKIKTVAEDASFIMWGVPVRIISFSTLGA